MTLLVDLGNSRIKWATSTGGALHGHGAAVWRERDLAAVIDAAWTPMTPPARVVVGSVLDTPAREALGGWVYEHWSLEAQFLLSPAEAVGVRNAYAEPSRLGVDRFAALVAAHDLHAGPCCVADLGTALTVDAVTADGRHLGGLIVPGIAAMRRSLLSDTRGIRDVDGESRSLLACSTSAAVASGTVYAAVALIDRVVSDLADQLGERVGCIVCGGDAATVLPLLSVASEFCQDLVLRGLALMVERG